MKKSDANSKHKSLLAQLQLTFPADKLQSILHAIAIKEDTNMTRIYSVIQPNPLRDAGV